MATGQCLSTAGWNKPVSELVVGGDEEVKVI